MRADLCSVKAADIDVSVKCTSIVELGTEGDEDENSMVEASALGGSGSNGPR